MKPFLLALLLVFVTQLSTAQTDTLTLTRKVELLRTAVEELPLPIEISQEAVRLNFENCQIEITRNYTDGQWEIVSFYFQDLVGGRLEVDDTNYWKLEVSTGKEYLIKRTTSKIRPGKTNEASILYSTDKERLESAFSLLKSIVRHCKRDPFAE